MIFIHSIENLERKGKKYSHPLALCASVHSSIIEGTTFLKLCMYNCCVCAPLVWEILWTENGNCFCHFVTCFALIQMKWLTGWREGKKECQLSVYRQVLRRLSAIFTLLHLFSAWLMQLRFKFNTINTQSCDVICCLHTSSFVFWLFEASFALTQCIHSLVMWSTPWIVE